MEEQEFSDSSHVIEELIDITISLSIERNLYKLLNSIVTGARRIAKADAGMVYLLDNTKTSLFVEVYQNASIGKLNHDFPTVPLYNGHNRKMDTLVSYCAFTGEVQRIDDIYKYSGLDFSDFYQHDSHTGYHSKTITAVPMRNHQNITVGILLLINIKDSESNKIIVVPKKLEGVIKAFAAQAAIAIENVKLMEKNQHLISVLNHSNQLLEQKNKTLLTKIQSKYDFSKIIGNSPAMQKVFSLLEKIIDSDAIVLIQGETGTGKEMIANTLHFNSKRNSNELIVQNCAALPENLLESELFGYAKGAFSGATSDKKGLIEMADGGTLFLDEIGDMPIGLQAKILRVLQDRQIRPLGSTKSKKINVRFIAATHCDLKEKIKEGSFREDLYYRLCVFPVELPPMRERKEDIPTMLHFFLKHFSEYYQKPISGYSPAALQFLFHHDYPGNVRDMRNIVERAVLMCEENGSILPEHIPDHIISQISPKKKMNGFDPNENDGSHLNSLKEKVEAYEAVLLEEKLKECHWNQTKTAMELKLARRTLIAKMNRYGINKELKVSDLNSSKEQSNYDPS